jgi:hypothetical protein
MNSEVFAFFLSHSYGLEENKDALISIAFFRPNTKTRSAPRQLAAKGLYLALFYYNYLHPEPIIIETSCALTTLLQHSCK